MQQLLAEGYVSITSVVVGNHGSITLNGVPIKGTGKSLHIVGGTAAQWVRATRGTVLLEIIGTKEARQILERVIPRRRDIKIERR